MSARVRLSDQVRAARDQAKPVVALESTIIAHGLPHPDNLNTARLLEDTIRAEGAEPATVAVIGGEIRVGLTSEELEFIATNPELAKLSRRDLPQALSRSGSGATTVAATMIAARLAGIAVFATGGIGGVHRGAQSSFDISADLEELARTPVCVVCAGAKAILDLAKTQEYLETKGVPVIGYGVDELPAFYCRESGLPAPQRCDTPDEVAALFKAQRELGFDQGMVVAVPVPQAHAMDRAQIEEAIVAGERAAKEQGIAGKAVTPFLLQELVTHTGGKSLATNIALARNNAQVAARIAAAIGGG